MMKKILILYFFGFVLFISCDRWDDKVVVDFTDARSLRTLLTGEWKDRKGNGDYIFFEGGAYEYYANSNIEKPTEEGETALYPATDDKEASLKFWYLSPKSGRQTYEWNLVSYENRILLVKMNSNSPIAMEYWLQKK